MLMRQYEYEYSKHEYLAYKSDSLMDYEMVGCILDLKMSNK